MHVRVASPDGGPRLTICRLARVLGGRSRLLAILSTCWLAGGCQRPPQASNLAFDWSLAPHPALVGPATLTLRVRDGAQRPVHGAHLRVEAQMSHPGMDTVLATAVERTDGVYEAALHFSMAGDWILLVAGSLANGDAVRYQIDVPRVRSSGGSADAAS